MALMTRRAFLIIPPAIAVAASFGLSSSEGLRALDAPPLAGVTHASGAPVKGFRFEQLTGWVTIVHALASWRPECEQECAFLKEIAGDERFQLAGLFVRDTEAAARAFIARVGNPYDALGFDADGRAERQLGLREAPSTFILNVRGQVVHTLEGPLTREYYEQTMSPVIDALSPTTDLLA